MKGEKEIEEKNCMEGRSEGEEEEENWQNEKLAVIRPQSLSSENQEPEKLLATKWMTQLECFFQPPSPGTSLLRRFSVLRSEAKR